MRGLIMCLVAIVAISLPCVAQCSTLSITGTINAGQTVTVDVSGAPAHAVCALAVGGSGSTSISLPGGGSLSLLVSNPAIIPLGMTDASGHVAFSANIPANIPASAIVNHTFTCQAVSVVLPMITFPLPNPFPMPTLSFCVSNTASLVSGTG